MLVVVYTVHVISQIIDGGACHATDGPPTNGPAGLSTANFAAINGPAGPSMAAMDGPAGLTTAP